MHYQPELSLLCDTLRKARVRTATLSVQQAMQGILPENASDPFALPRLSPPIEPYTLYKLSDALDLCYLYLLLPKCDTPTLLLIGPYLTATPSHERLLELGERCGISPAQQPHFEEYYAALAVLAEGDHLFTLLSGFCERIWQRPAFAIVDVNKKDEVSASPINEPLHNDRLDDVLLKMKTMERRYAFENELIRAVSLGQLHKEALLLSAFSEQAFEKRLRDPLRNAKNYSVIMNTLLRKAAENGGVHPVYLDRVSSEFAARIEQLSDVERVAPLMREIFRAYCRLVRKHALMHYSLVVQRAILLIDSDLSASLSLKSLAAHQNVSHGYLCSVFKKETGKTLSEYVREKRMHHAAHLLATTQLQIQTVALHCGIMDVQYFSKLFKRHTGKTPREYREAVRAGQEL